MSILFGFVVFWMGRGCAFPLRVSVSVSVFSFFREGFYLYHSGALPVTVTVL